MVSSAVTMKPPARHGSDTNAGAALAPCDPVSPRPGAGDGLAARLVDRVLAGLALGVRAVVVGVLLLSALRIAFVLRHGKALPPGASVLPAIVMGARFDLKITCVALLPAVLLHAAAASRRSLRVARTAWLALAYFALALTALVNDGYYAFFQRPLDGFVFGLVEDDSAAVWHSVWHEHPVVLGVLAAAALAAGATWLALRRRRGTAPPWAGSLRARAAMVVVAAGTLVLAIRGRATGFPLNEQDLAVSAVPFVNAVATNAAFSLWLAWQQRASLAIGTDPAEGLHRLGFASPAQAAAALGLAGPGASDEAVAAALFTVSRENPAAARPPHVVLAVMEGWGADLFRYHSPTNDLLGRLAPHAARAVAFRHFLAAQNGTDPTLEALLVGSPISPLTYSARGNQRYTQAPALPFRAAGYRTVFAIGGARSWRNIGEAMRNQGFDEIRDQADVLAFDPGAPRNIWGVHDGALFRWAAARLREADARGERLLLVLMTISNHTPHAVPAGYRVRPLDVAALGDRRLGDPALRVPILETYQYSSDALGGFLDEVRDAGLADRTIVAATGDHGTRSFFEYTGTSAITLRDAVPFLVFAPPAYVGGRTPDLDRWASHRDVFPTLAGLALSRARIFRSGDDLFSPPSRAPRALTGFDLVVSDAGAVSGLGTGALLRWRDGALVPCEDDGCRASLRSIGREERAYVALLDWNVRRQVIGAGRVAAARS